jgi:hypothetical protein
MWWGPNIGTDYWFGWIGSEDHEQYFFTVSLPKVRNRTTHALFVHP